MRSFITILIASLLTVACEGEPRRELHVFAAASLKESVSEIAFLFTKQNGVPVITNFAASSTLARQMREGARCDIFIAADNRTMDLVDRNGLIDRGSRRDLLTNELVIIVRTSTPAPPSVDAALAAAREIAIGDPEHVPAGVYAREWLEGTGRWDTVAKKIVPASNARAALNAVRSGAADLGIVYQTDAATSDQVRVIHTVDAVEAPEITYPVAITIRSLAPHDAAKFVDFLRSEEAILLFRRRGFGVIR